MQTSEPTARTTFERLTGFMPLIWLSLSFLAGILVDSQMRLNRSFWLDLARSILPARIPLNRSLWLLLAGAFILIALIFIIIRFLHAYPPLKFFHVPSASLLLVFLSIIAFLLGAARHHATIPVVDAHYISWYNDREYELLITGTLVSPPDERDTYTNLRMNVDAVNTGDETLPVHGLLLARIPPGGTWRYGDVVRVRGYLNTPPTGEVFSYQDYLSHQGIRAYMPNAQATLLPFVGGSSFLRQVYAFRDHAITHIYQIFPDPEASLIAGILLGEDNGLPADLQQAYKNTGMAHIIAISGFNITIIAGLFVTLFGLLLGRRKGAWAALAGILLYTLLVGATASVVRAAIMGGLAIFARQVGRRQNGFNTLSFTAAVMAAINPQVLWDVGFQLSFAATLGLILYAQPFEDWAVRLISRFTAAEKAKKVAGPISAYLLFTLAAQLTTLPIMAYQFGRVSLISIIANPFILPAQPALMILAGLAMLLSFVFLPLGKLVGWIAWPFAAYSNRMVEFFNGFPHGVIVLGEFSLLFVILYYALLMAWTFSRPRVKGGLRSILTPTVIIATLGVSAFLVWTAAFTAPDGKLHLTFLDVGSADAVLIQTPSGRTVLVNGGESPSALADALGWRLSPFDRHLDWLVVAAPQEQQVAALPVIMDRYQIDNVLWSGNLDASYSARKVNQQITDKATPLTLAYEGASLDLGEGATLKTLAISPRGAVLLVEWKGFRTLLPLGMNLDTLTELDNGEKIGPVTTLLLADSGFAPLNPPEWIAALRPHLVIISVAAGDPQGLPAQTVLEQLTGTSILRTDWNGWIEITTDGDGMWVNVEKHNNIVLK